MFYMCYICDVCPKVMFSFHARQSNIVIFIVIFIAISSRVASRDLAFARSIDAAMLFSSRAAALGASAPRARERRLDSRRGRLDRNRRPSRILARRPASSRAADPSEDDIDPLGARGERVAVVGVGTRGCALADALAEARALPNAEYWALNADVVKYLGKNLWVNTRLMDLVDAGKVKMVSRDAGSEGAKSDDLTIIEYAKDNDAWICSNDQFRDHRRNRSLGFSGARDLKAFARSRRFEHAFRVAPGLDDELLTAMRNASGWVANVGVANATRVDGSPVPEKVKAGGRRGPNPSSRHP